MKRAIVLSGGGAKGSYQIGVWKALRKLHIKYDIITGTSVGSLNGALMTQNTYYRGLWLWYNMHFNKVFNNNIGKNYNHSNNNGQRTLIKEIAKAALFDNGLEVTNLENNIKKVLNEKKLRNSTIDFGLVTFNLSSLKPTIITKANIPEGKLNDYLMASATFFPAFKKKNIDNQNYIDGGYYDNLPINLAIDMGADEIIAVDLGTVGFRRRIRDKKVKITYIVPRNNIGPFLIFDKNLARRGMRYGYNDTLKVFNKLDGNKFTFKRDHLSNNFNRYADNFKQLLSAIFDKKNNNIIVQLLKITTYKKELNEKDFTRIIESLGKIFEIDDSYIYNINNFHKILISKLDDMPIINKKILEREIKTKNVKNLINSKLVVKYIYDKINLYTNYKTKKELTGMALLLPNELLEALYLYTVKYYS